MASWPHCVAPWSAGHGGCAWPRDAAVTSQLAGPPRHWLPPVTGLLAPALRSWPRPGPRPELASAGGRSHRWSARWPRAAGRWAAWSSVVAGRARAWRSGAGLTRVGRGA